MAKNRRYTNHFWQWAAKKDLASKHDEIIGQLPREIAKVANVSATCLVFEVLDFASIVVVIVIIIIIIK